MLKEFKTYTSKQLRVAIAENPKESRRKWLLSMMIEAGNLRSNVKKYQFWQQNNHPIELWSNKFIKQKVNYIHMNPVKSGFVNQAEDWKYSSAGDYAGDKGQVEITLF